MVKLPDASSPRKTEITPTPYRSDTDARGLSVMETRTWDALNRPSTVSYPSSGENLTYTWDSGSGCTNGVGRLCRINDNGGSTTFSYDARGNVLTETRSEAGGSFTTQYSYDGADRVATLITPTGKLLSVQRNSDGKVQQLSTSVGANPQVKLVSNVQTDAAGNVTAQTFGNGVSEAKTFNTDGTDAQQTETPPSGSGGGGTADVPTLPEWAAILLGAVLLGIGYRRQRPIAGGRNTGGGKSGGFPPSALGSLLAVLLPGLLLIATLAVLPTPAQADEALTYDANGNVITRRLSGVTTSYDYDALDRIKSEAGPAKTQTLTYDGNGNRLSDASGTHTYTASTDRQLTIAGQSVTLNVAGHITQARGLGFVWNQAGQLKEVHQTSPSGPLLASYYYDYQGRRSRKVTTASAPQGAATILYFYDRQNHLIAEMTPQGNPLITYVWRDDDPVSLIVHGSPEIALYLETDHLNTPIAARNQAGTVVWKWESDAFGSTLPNEDPGTSGKTTTINLRFPGQYFDRESGLHYNMTRYYDPKIGRYLSSDPVGLAGGINTYTYVGGNPISIADPLGLCGPLTPVCLWIAANSAELTLAATIVAEVASGVPNLASAPAAVISQEVRAGWNVGDNIYNLTRNGTAPAWSTVRARFWKNEAEDVAQCTKDWGAKNASRMKNGQPPQRYNADKGGLEKMELSHEPFPMRYGGSNVVPRWPQDHAAVDPFRRPGY